jgi:superfamily I DNA/RNA helicase
MLHPVTNEEITFTNEQVGCINYVGDKRKNLVIRSAAGGGKSLVLIQRAKVYLDEAKRTGKKNSVVIFTYNHVLAKWLEEWMGLTEADSDYIKICTLHEYLISIYDKLSGFKLGNSAYPKVKVNITSETLSETAKIIGSDKYEKWGTKFWDEEFNWMHSMNIFDRSDRKIYMDMEREGRGHEHPMTMTDRIITFEMFCKYQDKLRAKKCFDDSLGGDERILYLTHNEKLIPKDVKFDHVLIDEAQDQSLAKMIALRSLALLDVTVCMDANQRIYEGRWTFSQAQLNPTSKKLSYPFRCTGQIDALAESLKAKNQLAVSDDDKVEHKAPTAIGEKPEIICCKSADEERRFIIALVNKWLKDDPIHTIGIMCYTNDAVKKIAGWLSAEHIKFDYIKNDEKATYSIKSPGVKVCTMHTSKGLEFMRVILPQFYQGMMPQNWALKDEEKLIQQRNVAYVGMTRAMHQLAIVYNGNKSKFVDEMDSSLYTARTFDEAVELEMKKPTPEFVRRELPKEELSGEKIVKESRRKNWSFS